MAHLATPSQRRLQSPSSTASYSQQSNLYSLYWAHSSRFRNPGEYISTMTRNSASFAASTAFLYTELGGAWLYFAFNEAIVLRLFDDLRLWRILCMGMLLSDAAYCHSVAQAVGGWGAWSTMGNWAREDWIVFWTTAPMVLVRILIVFGVGVKHQ